MRLALAVILVMACRTAGAAGIEFRTPPIEPGSPPIVQVTGLADGQVVRLWTVRSFTKWQEVEGRWVEVPVTLYAWADFVAVKGRVDTTAMPSLQGTYRGRDPYGLMWSGRTSDDPVVANAGMPAASDSSPGKTFVVAQSGTTELARGTLSSGEPEGLRVVGMNEGGIAGVYAAPTDGKVHPVVLLLHGSEGGSRDGARELAVRYAAQGYAAFAVIYFAYDLAGISGVSHQHVNTPIEWLDTARHWVADQPEADASRIGVYGHSKGAEFAAVAAVRYPWIDAVVACVPTDVVWEGYGFDDERNRPENRSAAPEFVSSWSWRGAPLPYIKLRPFDWRQPQEYFNNTERYELSRKDDPKRAESAAIPIEQSEAKFLLLGGEKDEVWASGAMALALARRFNGLPAERQPLVHVFQGAGHSICGDGTYPPRVYGTTNADPRSRDLYSEGAAAARAWELTKDFFARELSPGRNHRANDN